MTLVLTALLLVAGGLSAEPALPPHALHCLNHQAPVGAVAYSPDGKLLVTGTGDGVIHIWDVATLKRLRQLRRHERAVKAIAFSPDGKLLASASMDRTARLWEVASGKETRTWGPLRREVVRIAFAPDCKRIAAAEMIQAVHLWDVASGAQRREFQSRGAISFVTFSPDGGRLAVGGADSWVSVWRLPEGDNLMQVQPRERNEKTGVFWSAAFASEGKVLAAGQFDGCIYFWDAKTGKERRRAHGDVFGPFSMTPSPDGRLLAIGCNDKLVRLWEVATGRERARFSGHDDWVYSVVFSPDGRTLASASADQKVLLWDLTGRQQGAPVADVRLEGKDLQALWAELAVAEPAQAYQAMLTLLAAPAQSIPFLEERLSAAKGVDPDEIVRLIQDLEDIRYKTRIEASRRLAELGELAESALRMTLKNKPAPETRRRVEKLIELLEDAVLPPEHLQVGRALEVLEYLDSPDARQALERLARRAPAWPGADAKASLDRLRRRIAP